MKNRFIFDAVIFVPLIFFHPFPPKKIQSRAFAVDQIVLFSSNNFDLSYPANKTRFQDDVILFFICWIESLFEYLCLKLANVFLFLKVVLFYTFLELNFFGTE